ncbi:hypothetical protein [Pedobacter cryotolerans]|uniref:hypothetical protein n=1 Tax=Pedobacter cryotolerans TaxID=2571270 RepID=UPI001CECD60F|nr:hypothetical protein [Pedobacter cryotolerans]
MIKKIALISSFFVIAMVLISCQEESQIAHPAKKITLNSQFGINAFEWDFLQDPVNPADGSKIFEPKMNLMTSFGQFRHYLDWEKLEYTLGNYTFNPTRSGGWNLDVIYERCKKEGIEPLVCIKTIPNWLYKSYPVSEQTNENLPLEYPADRLLPASYIKIAKVGFQFAARYGANKDINSNLVQIDTSLRWPGDNANIKKIGLNTVKYIECNNEPDKWWRGRPAEQSPEEYAANLSAFYDGHMGKLGKNVGVKTADPKMMVVMGGLATPDVEYVKAMVEWCRKNRGLKADGSVNLCFDVINYHLYANNNNNWFVKLFKKHRGQAPENSDIAQIANNFVKYARSINNNMEVWNTESGYDIDLTSPQKAIAIKEKSALLTQADWTLRSSLLYARHGINRAFYYMFTDLNPPTGRFASSGFVEGDKRRPVADYFYQVKNLMGNYHYESTINKDPFVDVYALGDKKMYVLAVPDEVGREEEFTLNVFGATKADIFTLKPGNDQMDVKRVNVVDGKIKLTVTETPIFVRALKK